MARARKSKDEEEEDEEDENERRPRADEDGPKGPDDDDEDDDKDDEEDGEKDPAEPPDHPDIKDLTEQLAVARAEAEERATALAHRERELEEERAVRARTEQDLVRTRSALIVAAGAGDAAEAVARATSGSKGPSTPAATAPAAPARPPTTVGSNLPRKERPRYKDIPEADKVDLTENDMVDIEFELKRGLRPTEVLDSLGYPANRYTLDQVRSIHRTLQNRGEAPSPGAAAAAAHASDPLGGLKTLTETVKVLEEAGLVISRKDFDERMDELRDDKRNNDSEMGELKETLHVGREMVVEVMEGVRDITGHPKRGSRVADELAQKRLSRTMTAAPATPALAGVSEGAPAPPGPPAASKEQQEATLMRATHPEAFGTIDYVIRLAPRIYDQLSTDAEDAVIQQNAEKDAATMANLVWVGARTQQPPHLMDSNTGRCVRCNVGNTPDNAGKPCPVAWSQKDMLRNLKGTTVRGMLEQINRYQSTIEMNAPLDTLGGLSLRQYIFAKKWGSTDDPNLGDHTIFDVITSPLGLFWMGKFIDVITEKVIEEETRGTEAAAAAPRPDAPPVPVASARSEA